MRICPPSRCPPGVPLLPAQGPPGPRGPRGLTGPPSHGPPGPPGPTGPAMGNPATVLPLPDGVATIGLSRDYARADHVHPGFSFTNIKDFGAVGDGVTSDVAAFNAFNTWARAQTTAVTLIIPPGTYAGLNSNPGGGADFWVGIKDITIFGYGATIPILYGPNGLAYYAVGAHSPITLWAQIATVSSGSTTVTCNTPAQAGQFSVGQWVCVSSLEMQGAGFPPNFYYYDYVQIAAINTSTGVITLSDPLNYTHKSTFPDTAVSTFSANGGLYPGSQGGPASVFAMNAAWDATVKIYGLTVTPSLATPGSVEANLCARRVRCIDCAFIGNFAPTTSLFSTFENCTFTGSGNQIEVDKNIAHLKFINCRIGWLNLQSASDDIDVDGCHITKITGNTKRLALRNSYINTDNTVMTAAVGANRETIIENCHYTNLTVTNNVNYLLMSDLTFSNGTFSMALSNPKVLSIYRFAIPGSKCFFMSNYYVYNLASPFIITNVYQDSTNVYFDTTLTSVPAITGAGSGAPGIVQHPAPRLTAFNNTGNDTAIVTGKQAAELPLFSYAHKVYSADLIQPSTTALTQQIQQWGNLVSLKVNVIRADTGANVTLTMRPLGVNGAWVINPSNAITQFTLTINLKTAGVRTVTPTTVTGNVAGDVIAAPGAVWFVQYGLNPWMSASIAANTPVQMPIVEIELITDQGITAFEYTVQ